MRYIDFILCLVCAAGVGCSSGSVSTSSSVPAASPILKGSPTNSSSDDTFARAFQQHISNVEVEGQGFVRRSLPDDTEGSQHQRFVIALESGQTLLIVHNLDLAQRVVGIREGDPVSFKGVYEWNAEGGVIHWTHHDPNGRHVAGWIRYNGKVYQ